MEKHNEFPTMEERLERLQASRAASPAHAAAKVIAISGMESEEIFKCDGEQELLSDMLPEHGAGQPIRHYQEWMSFLEKLLPETGGVESRACVLKPEPDFESVYGHRFTNAMLLLALIFYYSVKDEKRRSRLGSCLRMTLGDYTDAVIDLSYTDAGKPDEKHLKRARAWKRKLVEKYDENLPLVQVIEEVLNRYLEGWQMIGYAEHVVKCRNGFLSESGNPSNPWDYFDDSDEYECEDELEDDHENDHEDEFDHDAGDEDGESCNIIVLNAVSDGDSEMSADEEYDGPEPMEDPEYDEVDAEWRMFYEEAILDEYFKAMDPHGYYLGMAQEFDEELPVLKECGLSVAGLAKMFFLAGDVYRMDIYREELSQESDHDFLELLEEHASDAKFLQALNKINSAVNLLKALLYDPYHGTSADDAIVKYHYEKHLETGVTA